MQVGGPQAPPHRLEVAPWPGDRGSAPLCCYPTLRLFTGPALGTKSAEEAILPMLGGVTRPRTSRTREENTR